MLPRQNTQIASEIRDDDDERNGLCARVVVDRALALQKRRRTRTRLNRAAHQSLGGKQELTVALFSPPQDLDFYFWRSFFS